MSGYAPVHSAGGYTAALKAAQRGAYREPAFRADVGSTFTRVSGPRAIGIVLTCLMWAGMIALLAAFHYTGEHPAFFAYYRFGRVDVMPAQGLVIATGIATLLYVMALKRFVTRALVITAAALAMYFFGVLQPSL